MVGNCSRSGQWALGKTSRVERLTATRDALRILNEAKYNAHSDKGEDSIQDVEEPERLRFLVSRVAVAVDFMLGWKGRELSLESYGDKNEHKYEAFLQSNTAHVNVYAAEHLIHWNVRTRSRTGAVNLDKKCAVDCFSA